MDQIAAYSDTMTTLHFIPLFLLWTILLITCCSATSTPSRPNRKPLPTILGEEFTYKRWRTILERTIRFPNGKVVDFDLVGMVGAGSAVVVFAWDSLQKTATLVREYHPGPNKFLFGAAAGIVEDDKHNGNVELAAQHELEEECHLAGGSWHLLTPEPLAMDKYSTITMRAFLVMDASHVPDPQPQDHEEDIEIIQNVSVDEIMTMIRRGEMNVVGAWACLMAIEKLREMGEIK
mmetsp:Transcript_23575/g.42798  ORF Transcript_23575/g.42798 Transcript_23575/m.42798 type:complete len:234 (-) Transcript_23575:1506-2207(-)